MNSLQRSSGLAFFILVILLFGGAARANVVGVDTQNFNPTTNGLDFVTVQSSETLQPGIINLGFFLNYAVNTLPYLENNPNNRSSFNDSLFSGDFNIGAGLLKNWDVGMSFPAVLSQAVQSGSSISGQFNQTGSTEYRPNTKYHIWGDGVKGLAAVGSIDFNRVGNNPYTGIGGGPTYNLELVADTHWRDFGFALNLGHRWRSPGTAPAGSTIQPFKNQIIYSAGANYLVPHTDTKIIAEIFGGQAADSSTDPSGLQSSLEGLIGVKHMFTQHLAAHAGFGTEINHATASPDWRVYTGLNFTFGPIWAKNENLESIATEKQSTLSAQDTFIAHNILFEFNSDVLTGDYAKTISELVEYMRKPPLFKKLTIEGHTDSVGSEEYNKKLSQKRADAIKRYIVQTYQIPTGQVESIGYGPARPIADNGNYQGRQVNRRVEFKIDR